MSVTHLLLSKPPVCLRMYYLQGEWWWGCRAGGCELAGSLVEVMHRPSAAIFKRLQVELCRVGAGGCGGSGCCKQASRVLSAA